MWQAGPREAGAGEQHDRHSPPAPRRWDSSGWKEEGRLALDNSDHHGPTDDELLARLDADGRDPDGAAFIAIWTRHRIGVREALESAGVSPQAAVNLVDPVFTMVLAAGTLVPGALREALADAAGRVAAEHIHTNVR